MNNNKLSKDFNPGSPAYDQYGFWTVDGSSDFGVMPAGIIPTVEGPISIKLQAGNMKWGYEHIQHRHGQWLRQNKHTVASMVHAKLCQTGKVYSTEEDDKTKVSLSITPSALLVLRFVPQFNFLTVVSIYPKQGQLDGTYLGRYKAESGPPMALRIVPVYAPPPAVIFPQEKRA